MTFNPAIGIRRVNNRVETPYLRKILAALILLAICFFAVGAIVLVTRAQNPNCVELKKRLDDANRGYQTVLAQSQSADKNFISYQSTVRRLQSDLIANDKRREQAGKDLADAQRDRGRCQRDFDVLPTGGCADVKQRIAAAEKNISYTMGNQKKLEADLSSTQQKLSTARVTLSAASANLTTAQQELDDANKAYAAAGCPNENVKSR
jgi:septal ring factor EnvC (AmiA/AmiB activator)